MWVLPTRGRPALCQAFLDTAAVTGMRAPAILLIDERGGEYPKMRYQNNWIEVRADIDMADAMRKVFREYPAAAQYGWLADDFLARTQSWDQELEATAGSWFMAHCNDLDLSLDPGICIGVLSGAMCWGGDLVREVGWWALPDVKQGGIDDAWIHLFARLFNLKRYRQDVIVEHRHYNNRKRVYDETDERFRDGAWYIQDDLNLFEKWRHTAEPHEIVKRVRSKMQAAGYNVDAPEFMPVLP